MGERDAQGDRWVGCVLIVAAFLLSAALVVAGAWVLVLWVGA